jgi:hypothetical protein
MHVEVNIPDDLVEYYTRGEGGPDRPLADKFKELLEDWCRAMINECPEIAEPVRQRLYERVGLEIEDDET